MKLKIWPYKIKIEIENAAYEIENVYGDDAKDEWLLGFIKKLAQFKVSKHCSCEKNECYEKWTIWWWWYEKWVSNNGMCIDLDDLIMQKMNDEREGKKNLKKKVAAFCNFQTSLSWKNLCQIVTLFEKSLYLTSLKNWLSHEYLTWLHFGF